MLIDMASRGPHKHCCKVCNKSFPSGRALGGHMACHYRTDKQPRSTPSPPATVVDLHVSLLDPFYEKFSPPSFESQCLQCPRVFSACQSLRGHMRIHSKKKVMVKPEEEPAGLMQASANADGDQGHNMMIFSPVKRKRSKRVIPALMSDEMDAAVTLVMLSEDSAKTAVFEDCCGEDDDGDSKSPNSKEVKLTALDPQLVKICSYEDCCVEDKDDYSSPPSLTEVKQKALDHQLVQSDDFTTTNTVKNAAYEDIYEHCKKEINNLNLFVEVPKKEVRLNDHGLDSDTEFLKPGAGSSVEELKSHHLSAAVSAQSHQCNACGKHLRSGQALGGHMRYHYVRRYNRRQGVAACPDSAMMEEKKQKLELKSEWLDFNLPALINGG